jgi:hypothetical protein
MQWPKDEEHRQCNGRKMKNTDNAMAERRRTQTMQWPKEKGQTEKQ